MWKLRKMSKLQCCERRTSTVHSTCEDRVIGINTNIVKTKQIVYSTCEEAEQNQKIVKLWRVSKLSKFQYPDAQVNRAIPAIWKLSQVSKFWLHVQEHWINQ